SPAARAHAPAPRRPRAPRHWPTSLIAEFLGKTWSASDVTERTLNNVYVYAMVNALVGVLQTAALERRVMPDYRSEDRAWRTNTDTSSCRRGKRRPLGAGCHSLLRYVAWQLCEAATVRARDQSESLIGTFRVSAEASVVAARGHTGRLPEDRCERARLAEAQAQPDIRHRARPILQQGFGVLNASTCVIAMWRNPKRLLERAAE